MNPAPEQEALANVLRANVGATYAELAECVAAYLAGLPPQALAALLASAPAPAAAKPAEGPVEAPRALPRLPVGWRPHHGGPCPVEDHRRVFVWMRGAGQVRLRSPASFWRRGQDLWRWEGKPNEQIVGYMLCD